VAELLDAGVHIVTQDIDTCSENYKILLSVHGAMADDYRDQIAYRTRRGREGRARNGTPTGGRAYGYIALATPPPTGVRYTRSRRKSCVGFLAGTREVRAMDCSEAERGRRPIPWRILESDIDAP